MKLRYDGVVHDYAIYEHKQCLCSTGTAKCDHMTIRGLDWKRITWAKKVPSGREAWVTLRGILTREGLELTEPPERLPDPKETITSGPLPCSARPGGFRQRHSRVALTDYDRMIEYAEAQTELSELRFHYFAGITLEQSRIRPPRSTFGPIVFRFVSNAELHRTKLEELWGGPICVVQGGFDKEIREGISARGFQLIGSEGRKHGLLCGPLAGWLDGMTDELVIHATTYDRRMLESWLSKQLAGFPVRVESSLDAL